MKKNVLNSEQGECFVYLRTAIGFRFDVGERDVELLQQTVLLVTGHERHVHVVFLCVVQAGD